MKKILTIFTCLFFFITGCSGGSSTPSVYLTSISLSGNYQTSFSKGDAFNYDGLIVTASYSDKSNKVVDDYIVSQPDMSYVGTQEVTVTYKENSKSAQAQYSISISEQLAKLSYIVLSGDYQTTFASVDEFNYNGLIVTAYYTDESHKQVTNFTVDPSLLTEDGGTVIVSYTEGNVTKNTTYIVTINKAITAQTVFNEPYIGRQYYLNHIGDIYSAWKDYRGRNVTIAVIDKAFDAYHEDFKDINGNSKISTKSASFTYNGSSVTTNVGINYVHDLSDSHGTFCAGVAAAAINNKGVIGVAPEANLMLIKTDGKPQSIVKGFKYAADNGAKVITISIGSYYNYDGDLVNDGSDLSTVFDEPIAYCRNKGVAVCSAAGNGGEAGIPTEYTFPGASKGVIGCGGLANNSNGEIWTGSSYNSSSSYQFADVFAPAENMFNICNFQRNGKQVLYDGGWNGTSFASPIVAGLAALYFEKYPSKGVSEFETDLYNSCYKITTSSIATSSQLGYGRVDVKRLLNIDNNYSVTLKVKSNWSNVYVYAWNSNLSLEKELKSWPGQAMSKSNGYFTYSLNVSDYDCILFSDGNNNKSVDLLSSSFMDGYTYDISSSFKENSLFVGNYIQ